MALHEPIAYRFEVANIGQGTARKVVVEMTPAEDLKYMSSKPSAAGTLPLTWEFAEIAPGKTQSIECDIASLKGGKLTMKGVVKAADGLSEKDEHTIVIGEPKLAIFLSGPSQRGTGRNAVYQITVRNTGEVPAADVELTDEPIADSKVADVITRVSATGGGKIDGNVARWNLATLAPGAEQSVQVVLLSRVPGKFTYVCTARTKGGRHEQAQAQTTFNAVAALDVELDRASPAAQVKLGAEVAYTLRVRNAGTAANTNVDVLVTIPDGLELIEMRAPNSSRPPGPTIRLPMINRLESAKDMAAILRFRAIKAGTPKLEVKAASGETGPDRPARAEDVVTIEK